MWDRFERFAKYKQDEDKKEFLENPNPDDPIIMDSDEIRAICAKAKEEMVAQRGVVKEFRDKGCDPELIAEEIRYYRLIRWDLYKQVEAARLRDAAIPTEEEEH